MVHDRTQVDIEHFAALRAEIEEGAELDAVLGRAELTALQWIAIERRWLRELARSVRRGDRGLADRYAAAFELNPTDGPDESVAPSMSGAAVPMEQEPGGSAPRGSDLAALPRAPAMGPVEAPATAPIVAVGQAREANAGQVAVASASVDETAFMAPLAVVEEPLPFSEGTSGDEAKDWLAEPISDEPDPLAGETVFVSALSDKERAEPLPFSPSEGEHSPSSEGDVASASSSVDETAFLSPDAPLEKPLPFSKGSSGVVPSPSPALTFSDERTSPKGEGAGESSSVDSTAFISPSAVFEAPLPFLESAKEGEEGEQSKPPPGVVDLTLEQYGSLRVELARAPGRRAAVLRRYRITSEEALKALDAFWSRRFRENPALFARFRATYDRYGDWLSSQQGGGGQDP